MGDTGEPSAAPTFLPCAVEILNRLMRRFRAGAHHDDDVLGVGRADVVEQVVAGGRRSATNLSITFCTMVGQAQVVRIDRFAALEINVRILRRAAQHRMIGRQRATAMRAHQLVVDHGAHVVVG